MVVLQVGQLINPVQQQLHGILGSWVALEERQIRFEAADDVLCLDAQVIAGGRAAHESPSSTRPANRMKTARGQLTAVAMPATILVIRMFIWSAPSVGAHGHGHTAAQWPAPPVS